MILSGLTVVVGVASIGVNRLLISSQGQVLSESIAIIQRTEQVARDVDRADALVTQLAQARTEGDAARTSTALHSVIGDIAAGNTDMRRFLGDSRTAAAEADEALRLVEQLTAAVGRAGRLARSAVTERQRLEAAGERLGTLISAGTNLARLRITADIWQLYSVPAGHDPRPLLDHLADRDFFAFERLAELAKATASLSRLVQQLAEAHDESEVQALRDRLAEALSLAQARAGFLPSAGSDAAARKELAAFADSGLARLRQDELQVADQVLALSAGVEGRLALLAEEAQRGREATREQMRQRIANAANWAMALTVALILVIVLAVFGGYWVWARTRRQVVLRLGAVTDRMVRVARGETGEMMRISGHDEIGQLEKALNVLRRRTDEALRLRRSLESAVLARTADVVAEMNLANVARAEAEELSRAKTHFLARMSHEIRTPLNGVIGLLDLLAADEVSPARKTRLETALTSARDLQAMTEDILRFSVSEETPGESIVAAFDPGALAQGVGHHLQVLAGAKGLSAVVQIAADLPANLIGDAGRIRQVLVNLISNAVKYTERGEVRLAVMHHTVDTAVHEIAFSVADTGAGMTAEEARHAFDVYGRTAEARRKGLPGVGLGLAIVRQLTDAMGGELRISTAPGRGSTFTLVLRLTAGDPAALAAEDMTPAPGLNLPGLRVLVVDDHPVNRLVARGYLERMGASVAEAASGGEGLEAAATDRFDAILIDLDLPDMRGEDVIQAIDRKGARLAIFTADLVRDDVETRARFGVDHVLTKPLSPRALALLLEGVGPLAPAPDSDDPLEDALREDVANLGAELVGSIVAAFLSDLDVAQRDLWATADSEARRRIAHRLKGAASNFALHDLCGLLQRIEKGDDAALADLASEAAAAKSRISSVSARLGLQADGAAAKQ